MTGKPDTAPRIAPLLLLGDSLTVFLLLAGGLFAALSAYGVATDTWVLLGGCGMLAVLSALLWSLRKGGRVALGLLGAWALLGWRFREPVSLILGYLEDQFRGRQMVFLSGMMSDALWEQNRQMFLRQQAAKEWLLPVLLFLAAGLALGLGFLAVRARRWYLAALVELLPVIPAILAGTLPNWWAMLAGTVGWGTLLLTALFSPRDRRSLGWATLLSQAGLAALLVGLTFALPMEGYTRPHWATNARTELYQLVETGLDRLPFEGPGGPNFFTDWLERLGLRFGSGSGGGAGGQGGGGGETLAPDGEIDLRSAGPRRYTGRTVLTVKSDASKPEGRIYLRGWAAGVYTGVSWEVLDETEAPDSSSILFYPARTAGQLSLILEPELGEMWVTQITVPGTMMIHHMDAANTMAYYPYRPSSLLTEGVAPAGSGMLEKTVNLREYQVQYIPGGPEDGMLPVATGYDPEWNYRPFAYESYTQVPDGTRRILSPLLEALAAQEIDWPEEFPGEHQDAIAAARRVAKLLSGLAVYDADTPAMGAAADFMQHFLDEGRGYCVHFATAGALLLRLEGVPARYVSGYVADLNVDNWAAVPDSAAHAWVEIYLDGYGWYPVEMTPGYIGTFGPARDEEPDAPPEDEPAPDDPLQPEQPDLPEEQDPLQPELPEDPGDGDTPPADGLPGGAGEDPLTGGTLDLTWLRRGAELLLLLAVPFALYALAMLWRRSRRTQPDANRAVIAAYRRCRRLLRWGCGEDETLESLARKAKFSQYTLTAAERAAAWERLDLLFARTGTRLPWWKRWCFLLCRPIF